MTATRIATRRQTSRSSASREIPDCKLKAEAPWHGRSARTTRAGTGALARSSSISGSAVERRCIRSLSPESHSSRAPQICVAAIDSLRLGKSQDGVLIWCLHPESSVLIARKQVLNAHIRRLFAGLLRGRKVAVGIACSAATSPRPWCVLGRQAIVHNLLLHLPALRDFPVGRGFACHLRQHGIHCMPVADERLLGRYWLFRRTFGFRGLLNRPNAIFLSAHRQMRKD